MEHYVTLFDSLFLPQGLALHMSMERHVKDYTLWILCVDDESHAVLTKLQLPNMRLLQLSKLETEELLRVKPNRSKGEYCWTLTPFAPQFVFETDASVERVTYLDADLWFRMNPQPIFDEFDSSDKYVLITDHAYAPDCDQSEMSGKYCVQFIIFQRGDSELLRNTWEKQCIEWCYAKSEGNKFGDQKYLDEWPIKFPEVVHIMSNKEFALAPWNAMRFPFNTAIFYHFHGLRIVNKTRIIVGFYSLPEPTVSYVYRPYFKDLKTSVRLLQDVGFQFKQQGILESLPIRVLRVIKRRISFGILSSNYGVLKW